MSHIALFQKDHEPIGEISNDSVGDYPFSLSLRIGGDTINLHLNGVEEAIKFSDWVREQAYRSKYKTHPNDEAPIPDGCFGLTDQEVREQFAA